MEFEFAREKCYLCGAKLGKPKEVTELKERYVDRHGMYVTFAAPCPKCGEGMALCASGESEAPPEPEEPEPEPGTE